MSWQSWVDDSLVAQSGGSIDKAAITDHLGSPWAKSEDFKYLPEEVVLAVKVLQGDEELKDRCYAEGIFFNGQRYILKQIRDGVLMLGETATKDSQKNETGQTSPGICIAALKTAVFIVHHVSGPVMPVKALNRVTECMNHLKKTDPNL